uniref:Uncharacterized protein n=1 Tax=Chaetoceros debilis TaxID=122233 RepID=A0A6S8V0G4_9STRA|mmetsp:Transcript_3529/g.5218  ORF Transcript_3529/g.5218 Transcript_3529/m.5218 type:complete len:388 (+) Transcript_3529:87-1250(+)
MGIISTCKLLLVSVGFTAAFMPVIMTTGTGTFLQSSKDTNTNTVEESRVSASSSLNHVDGIEALSSSYSTFLLDMWGVMHNGSVPYEGVVDTIQTLKDANKRLIILSNSSKRVGNAKKMLNKLGFNEEDFEQIITSGEISYRMLCGDDTLECSTWSVLQDLIVQKKKKVFVLGSGDGDEDYCKSSGWTLSSIEDADLIIARGTFTINNGGGSDNVVNKKDDGEEEYFRVLNESLEIAARKNVPMLVTNPDKVRPDEGLPPMPGAIGDSYEKILYLGGSSQTQAQSLVKRIGKPYPEVYELALSNCDDPGTAVMVGDALETDVTGGAKAKCATAWVVNDGIHSASVDELGEGNYEKGAETVLVNFNEQKEYVGDDVLRPSYVAKHFRW